jgi:hypothetical protein
LCPDVADVGHALGRYHGWVVRPLGNNDPMDEEGENHGKPYDAGQYREDLTVELDRLLTDAVLYL